MKSITRTPQITYRLLLSAIILICFGFINACSDDDEDGPKFEGKYKLTSATLTSSVEIVAGPMAGTTLPVGTPITEYVSASLFSVVTCDDPANAAIELSSNKELHFICIGESADTKGGSWSSPSNTELDLQLSSPPFTSNLPVNVTDVTVSGNTLEGDITDLPFAGTLFGDSSTPVYLVDMHIVFTKQ